MYAIEALVKAHNSYQQYYKKFVDTLKNVNFSSESNAATLNNVNAQLIQTIEQPQKEKQAQLTGLDFNPLILPTPGISEKIELIDFGDSPPKPNPPVQEQPTVQNKINSFDFLKSAPPPVAQPTQPTTNSSKGGFSFIKSGQGNSQQVPSQPFQPPPQMTPTQPQPQIPIQSTQPANGFNFIKHNNTIPDLAPKGNTASNLLSQPPQLQMQQQPNGLSFSQPPVQQPQKTQNSHMNNMSNLLMGIDLSNNAPTQNQQGTGGSSLLNLYGNNMVNQSPGFGQQMGMVYNPQTGTMMPVMMTAMNFDMGVNKQAPQQMQGGAMNGYGGQMPQQIGQQPTNSIKLEKPETKPAKQLDEREKAFDFLQF